LRDKWVRLFSVGLTNQLPSLATGDSIYKLKLIANFLASRLRYRHKATFIIHYNCNILIEAVARD
jgi:hypothetical protein